MGRVIEYLNNAILNCHNYKKILHIINIFIIDNKGNRYVKIGNCKNFLYKLPSDRNLYFKLVKDLAEEEYFYRAEKVPVSKIFADGAENTVIFMFECHTIFAGTVSYDFTNKKFIYKDIILIRKHNFIPDTENYIKLFMLLTDAKILLTRKALRIARILNLTPIYEYGDFILSNKFMKLKLINSKYGGLTVYKFNYRFYPFSCEEKIIDKSIQNFIKISRYFKFNTLPKEIANDLSKSVVKQSLLLREVTIVDTLKLLLQCDYFNKYKNEIQNIINAYYFFNTFRDIVTGFRNIVLLQIRDKVEDKMIECIICKNHISQDNILKNIVKQEIISDIKNLCENIHTINNLDIGFICCSCYKKLSKSNIH